PDGDGDPDDGRGGSTEGNDPDDSCGLSIKDPDYSADPRNRDDPEIPDDPVGQSPPGYLLLRRVVGIGRVRSAAQLPPIRGICAQACPPANRMLGEESVRDGLVARWLGWIAERPERARGIFPDGHGGECVPSRAAVTYRPSARVAAFVRTAYRTCTFPNCDVPSVRCQIDHLVPFDKGDPGRGGWTIVTNLQPVCVFHHQAKTSKAWSAVMLAGGAILWSNSLGLRAVTLPEFSIASPPRRRRRRKKSAENALSPFEPTRWELEYTGSAPPTLADFRSASSDIARKTLAEKRRAYLDHCRVVHVRIREGHGRCDPAPF
ncbi:HNH endonuclease signature motif containing protein, partial [Rhodococcus yunnanensis]